MSKSIADQLLGLGLADKKQIQKDKASKRKQDKQKRKHKTGETDESKLAAEQARKEKAEKDRQLNLERQQQANQKALLAQVKQIAQRTEIKSDEGDIKFNFVDKRDQKIKSVYVTEKIQNDLANGKLSIVVSEEKFYVVTSPVASKIAERSEESIVFVADHSEEQIDEDDPYKDYVIPDDLMW